MFDVERISRLKKDRYLRSLSEDNFRDKVIRPLFLRLGYKDGRDLCGPTEAGRDAIFLQENPLGLLQAIAVQTKVGNLNLASKASSNILEAVTQLKTALGSSYVLIASRQKMRPLQVYLCTSGKINDAAREHILSQVGDPNIIFLDGDDLVPRIDVQLPELWLGIEADILPYFNAIDRWVTGGGIPGVGRNATTTDTLLGGAATDANFVALNLHRTVVRTSKRRGRVEQRTEVDELPLTAVIAKKTSRVLITGEAGSGKSTGLLRLAYVTARRSLEEPHKYTIPIVLRSLDLLVADPTDLAEYADRVCRDLTGLSKPCFTGDDLDGGRIALLIDSLDELPSDEKRVQVLDLVERFLGRYPRSKVVVTSRPYRFISQLALLKGYETYRISPISWRQAEKIMLAVRKGQPITHAQSQEMLRRLEKLHGIALNPLLVAVFAASSDVSKQDIPANITELFKKFTEMMLGRWDETKGLRQQYQAPLKDFVLTKLAYRMHRDRQIAVSRDHAESVIREELALRGHEADTDVLLGEIIDRSGLFIVHEEQIEFRHLMIQEYFAGRGILSSEEARLLVVDEWWKRPLVFYFGEHPERIETLGSLVPSIVAGDEGHIVTAATTVGLALQACYLSPVAEKLKVWRWVVDALAISIEPFLKSVDRDGRIPNIAFAHYYLYGRDSVALSHLSRDCTALGDWARRGRMESEGAADLRTFWLIVGLVESGDIAAAKALLKHFKPADRRLLMGIHLGCHLTARVRPATREDKAMCEAICKDIEPRIASLRVQVAKELGSELLEWRDGRPQAVNEDV